MPKTKIKNVEMLGTDARLSEYMVPNKKVERGYISGDIYQINGKTEDYLIMIFQNSYELQQVTGFVLYKASTEPTADDYVDTDTVERIELPPLDNLSIAEDHKIFIDFGRTAALSYRYVGTYVASTNDFYKTIIDEYGKYIHAVDKVILEKSLLEESFEVEREGFKKEVDALKTKASEQAEKLVDYSKKVSYLKNRTETLTERNKGLKTDIETLMSTAEKSNKDVVLEISKYKEQIQKLKESLQDADAKIEALSNDNNDSALRNTIESLELENDQKAHKIENLMEMTHKYATEIEELKKAGNTSDGHDLGYYKGKAEAFEKMLNALLASKE